MEFSLLAFLSTVLGALVGVGGGLIIRPMLGLLGIAKSLAVFSSAITVLAMAVMNIITVIRRGAKIEFKGTTILAFGSVAGGFFGGSLLVYVNERVVGILYIFAMILVLLSVILRSKFKGEAVKNPFIQAFIGLITGTLSGFFGIGGGPFQMTAMLFFFKLEAAVQSIFITLLTTVSSLVRYGLNGYADFSLSIYMIPAAIAGGFIGGILNRRLSSSFVSKLFNTTVIAIIIVQFISLIK